MANEIFTTTLINDTSLKGYWRYENNLNDSSTDGYNLTDHSSSDSASGKFGHGRSFNGTSAYNDIAHASCPNLNITGSQTWIAWYNPTDFSINRGICGRDDLSNTVDIFTTSTNGFAFVRFNGLTTNSAVTSSNPLTTGAFNMVVGRYDSSAGKIAVFVNNTKTELTAGGSVVSTTGNWAIGDTGSGQGNFAKGVIDDVAIFNRALSDSEISQLYNGTYPLNTTTGAAFLFNFV